MTTKHNDPKIVHNPPTTMNSNNNPPKNATTPSIPANPPPIHLLTQSQPQSHASSSPFPGHFQLSQPQTHVIAQQPSHFSNPRAHPQTQQQQHQHVNQVHNNTNTNVASPATTTTTTTTTTKRSNQKPSSRPQGSPSGNQTSAFKTMELTPAPLRKKRSLPDKLIPEKVAKLVPESALYTRLLELEAQIDTALNRKKIDVQEAVKNPPSVRKTLRVYVYNTFSNQTKLEPGRTGDVEEPSWSLRITGKILEEDGKDPVMAGISKKESPLYPKFSAFFKKITVYLDQGFYPDNHVIVWDSARSSVLQDGFEVKRKGDKEFTAVIRLGVNYSPEKFMVSTPLAKILGVEFDTRPRIMAALWNYVKYRKLQSPNDPSFFMCDASLQKVFGEEKMKFSMASQKISQHLSQPQPIHVEHKIKLSGNCPAGSACYDVQVDVPLRVEKDMSALLTSMERHKEIDGFDEVIGASVKKIHEHLRRRAFLLGYSQSPAEFINALIASQSKDLKLVAGDASHNAENEQRSEFYTQPWVEDAVIRYLSRKSARTDVP
ncbi:SWI/SNF complex component SNF12 homolog [Cicer arietinum]|uniref:SWI/SNF complex component SNF12 homolog n=1 Tax=Cicer arietinum TaxID=3827 RepID=A0A1S2Z6B5_CICAR|nr:SWI/SNF complex component SNF12 homolog [Cicer arietinum]